MGNNKCVGYRRKARFAPGAELTGTTNNNLVHYVVLDVSRKGLAVRFDKIIDYYYKVYDKLTKSVIFVQPYYVERLSQINLLNIGNLRTLLDDAPSDGPDEAPSPNPPVPRGLTE